MTTLWTQVAVLLAAMPTGINAFIFARNYDIRVAVVTKTIVISTLLSRLNAGDALSAKDAKKKLSPLPAERKTAVDR